MAPKGPVRLARKRAIAPLVEFADMVWDSGLPSFLHRRPTLDVGSILR